MKKTILAGVGMLILGLIVVYVMNPLTITVTGNGEIEAPADTAVIAFTITETNTSPAVALQNLQNKASAMIALLKDSGYNEADLIVSQPTITTTNSGYQANMSMGGKSDRVKDVQVLASLLYERGAVYVSQPILSINQPETFQKQALAKAMLNAKDKMKSIASLRLFRKVVGIVESTDNPVQSTIASAPSQTTNQTDQVPASKDTIKINKTVVVTYKLW